MAGLLVCWVASMYVLGTAGHVDHGKSTLVFALTGIDRGSPCRRAAPRDDDRSRFAASGCPVGAGEHRRCARSRALHQKHAGRRRRDRRCPACCRRRRRSMPQTEEHLHILDLLELRHGLLGLPRADLVDADWLALVREDLRGRLAGTVLEDAERSRYRRVPAPASKRCAPRSISCSTRLRRGEATACRGCRLPGIRSRRLRHGRHRYARGWAARAGYGARDFAARPARAGTRAANTPPETRRRAARTRVAVNLGGVGAGELRRGDVLALPGHLRPTTLIDLKLRIVAGAPRPLRQNDLLDLFAGAAEVACHVTLLDAEQLRPGDEGWVQLRLEQPLAVARGDRCILRIRRRRLLSAAGGCSIRIHHDTGAFVATLSPRWKPRAAALPRSACCKRSAMSRQSGTLPRVPPRWTMQAHT